MSDFKTDETGSQSSSNSQSAESEADLIESHANTNAASRAIAVIVLMILPGIGGSYLDSWLGTNFFVLIGFGLGIGIAIFGLLYVAKIADVAAKRSKELRKRQTSKTETPNSQVVRD